MRNGVLRNGAYKKKKNPRVSGGSVGLISMH